MKRFMILPLFALAFLAGACSSPQSAKKSPSPQAKAAGTVETHWGNLPAYTSEQGKGALVFDKEAIRLPVVAAYHVKVDLLVDRDGRIKDVAVRESSGVPEIDAIVAQRFKQSRSRMVLDPTDAAPYVLQCALTSDGVPDGVRFEMSPYSLYPIRGNEHPMGQGQPTPRERGY